MYVCMYACMYAKTMHVSMYMYIYVSHTALFIVGLNTNCTAVYNYTISTSASPLPTREFLNLMVV